MNLPLIRTNALIPNNKKLDIEGNLTVKGNLKARNILLDDKTLEEAINERVEEAAVSEKRLYTWVKWSNYSTGFNESGQPEIFNDPGNYLYMGIAINQIEPYPSNNPSLYKWNRFRGERGPSTDAEYEILTENSDGRLSYTLSKTPFNKETLSVFVNGLLREGIILNNRTFTLPFSPAVGSVISAKYFTSIAVYYDETEYMKLDTYVGPSAVGSVWNSQNLGGTEASAFALKVELGDKVDKVTGKGLSTNDYTDTDKNKLAEIRESLGGTQYMYVTGRGNSVENAITLQNVYNIAKTMGASATNRITVVVAPGTYIFGATKFPVNTQYIDIVSLTGNPDVLLDGINVTANNVYLKGLNCGNNSFQIGDNLNNLKCENCISNEEFSFGGTEMEVSGVFNNCTGGSYSFGGEGTASGTFTNCIGGHGSFGGEGGTASGTFINCVGGNASFGGGGAIASTARLYYCRLTSGTFVTPDVGGKIIACVDGNEEYIIN